MNDNMLVTILPVNDIYKGFAVITDTENNSTFIYTPLKNYEFDEAKELTENINQSGITTIFENTNLRYVSTGSIASWSTIPLELKGLGTLIIETEDDDNYRLKTTENMCISCGVNVKLKSAHPEMYPDREITCKLIQNEEIGRYLARNLNAKKMTGIKSYPVNAKNGEKGFALHNEEKVTYEDKEYILKESDSVISERYVNDGTKITDILVTNPHTNEQKIISAFDFNNIYKMNPDVTYSPIKEPESLTQINENIVIIRQDKTPALCLKDSYIAAYTDGDYDVIEKRIAETGYTKL